MDNKEKNLCDFVGELIFSDEILTQETLDHIKNCQSCSKLLLQKKAMLNDLEKIDLIQDKAAFCASVVERINSTQHKKSGHIKFSRYAATAAAAALVVVSLFVLNDKTGVLDNEGAIEPVTIKNNTADTTAFDEGVDILKGVETDNIDYNDYEYTSREEEAESYTAGSSDKAETESEPEKEARVMLKMATPKTTNNTATHSDEPAQEENAVLNYSLNDDLPLQDDAVLFSAQLPDEEERNEKDTVETGFSGGGGGAGSASTTESSVADEAVNEPLNDVQNESVEDVLYDEIAADCEEQEMPLFSDVVFLAGQENLEYNLELVQKKLDEVFGEKYFVDIDACKNAKLKNSFVIQILKNATKQQFLDNLSLLSKYIYEKK